MTPAQLEILYVLLTQSVAAIFFAVLTIAWFLKVDCASLRLTGDYRRVMSFPVTHHIIEVIAYFFLGQLLKVFFVAWSLSWWWLVPALITMSAFTYRFAPGFAGRFDCPLPPEHRLLKPIVLLLLNLFAVLGFFVVLLL
jgi:hypothetical protein